MNYYPFYAGIPTMTAGATKTGLFSSLFKGLSLGKILTGSQKTLTFVNQTLPLIRQAKPMISNLKTMVKVMNEFKNVDNINIPLIKPVDKIVSKPPENETIIKETIKTNNLTFFQ